MIFEILGWIGSAILIIAYYLLSTHKLTQKSPQYHLLNLCGSLIFIIFSLYKFAYSSAFVNTVFLIIAIYAIYKLSKRRKRIYIDMDDTICDYRTKYDDIKAIVPNCYPQSRPGFFLHLEPLPNAIESIKELNKHYDVWILTRPSVKNLHCYSEKAEWIKDYLGEEWLEKLIISPRKNLMIGDYLIDDAVGFGQELFIGKFLKFGSDKYPDWKSIMEYFNK